MIPGVNYSSFNADSENKFTVSSGLPAHSQTGSMFSAILDELIHILKAESAAIVRFLSPRGEIVIELGRGDWYHWTSSHLNISKDLVYLLTMPGETSLRQGREIPLPFLYNENHEPIEHIYHVPLIFGDHHLGAIWLGHRGWIGREGFPLMSSIADVIASTLYSTRYEHHKPADKIETIQTLIKKLATWDTATFNHSLRMVPWAKATALTLGCSDEQIRTICWSTLLHDVGKLSVPKSILYKPGILTEDEWSVMKLHPSVGARMVNSVRKLTATRDIIGTHHEKYDGTGYPYGLKKETIPLGARILAVVDAFGAMTEERAYKKTYNHQEALDEIQNCTGKHFDPMVSSAFQELFHK